jgi:hypothetical protein
MAATEFERHFGLRGASQSPLFHLLRPEEQEGKEWLVFDEARPRECAAQDFEGFPDWERALPSALTREAGDERP